MKIILLTVFIIVTTIVKSNLYGQLISEDDELFNKAAAYYAENEINKAIKIIENGLHNNPSNIKLQELKKLIENQTKQKQQQQQQKQQEQKQQQQEQQENKISKEDAQRLLEALENDEKEVQKRLKKAKAQAHKITIEKDW